MATINKPRTDPPDKEKESSASTAAFPSAVANHTAVATPTSYQTAQSKDRLKRDASAVLSPPLPKQHHQQQQQLSTTGVGSTKTTTFQLQDNSFFPNYNHPHLVYENQQKPRQQKKKKQQQQQQQQHQDHQHHHKSSHENVDDRKHQQLPDGRDLNSNTDRYSQSVPASTASNKNFDHFSTSQNQQQHEPEHLITLTSNDPQEFKDNTNITWIKPSTTNGVTHLDPSHRKYAEVSGQSQQRDTNADCGQNDYNETSLASSSSVLSAVEQDLNVPLPRSSSPRLVRRQERVDVPCDDVAIIDIENDDDNIINSEIDERNPQRLPPNNNSAFKSIFYIGDVDRNSTFDDDISRINSVSNSDFEVKDLAPSDLSDNPFSNDNPQDICRTPADSSARSSFTETQRSSFRQKITYKKQKKASKKKSSSNLQDKKSENNDEDVFRPPSSTSGAKVSRKRSGKKNNNSNIPTSNWRRLRNTLKAANEMKAPRKQNHPLTREDSFLRKFSTRNHNNIQNNSNLTDEESPTSEVPNASTWTHLVIQHDGNFMFYWLGVVTLSVLYNLWTCIAREGFREIQAGCTTCWYFLDGLFDIIYVLDIIVQFRTGYLDQGLMVYDSKKLRKKYFSSKVIYVDFASLLPLDFVQLVVGVHPMLRFPRFLKTYRGFHFIHMLESRTAYPNFIRVFTLTHILFLGAHWFAAFYYMISEAEGFKGGWAYPPPEGNFADVRRKYLKSLYWSTLTLTTIGDLPQPENANEYVFVIVSYLIGVFVFATIVGQVGNVINNRNASRQEFERLLDGAKVYMQTHNVPQNLQKRVQRWYDYVWSRGRLNNGDINSLGLLPDKLKTELAIHVNLETLKKVTIFQECQPEFLHDLVLKMKAYIFTPGDLICRRGEVAREMFIIADGLVEIISETGIILKRMGAGDFFGEIGILNLDGGINRRSADVRSVGYLELFVLSRDDILGALKDHPEAESIIRDYGQRRLREVEAHRQRVKPLKCPESVLDAPTGGQTVQNRLLMTLRSLSPAVRRQSSQLANAGRQASLQNPPPPASPLGANSKRSVAQRSRSHGSSPCPKPVFDRSLRKTKSNYTYSSSESFREPLGSKQSGFCESGGDSFDENVTFREKGHRKYLSGIYTKFSSLFKRRIGGRRTHSVMYDNSPGIFHNLMWENGDDDDRERLSSDRVTPASCQSCVVTVKVDKCGEESRCNTPNDALSDGMVSSSDVENKCETTICDSNSVDHSNKMNSLQICDEKNEGVPSFSSKLVRVIQGKMGWTGNVSYTPVSKDDPDENHKVDTVKGEEESDDQSVFYDNDEKYKSEALLAHEALIRKRVDFRRNRTQSLGNGVRVKSSSKDSETKHRPNRSSHPIMLRSAGSLDLPSPNKEAVYSTRSENIQTPDNLPNDTSSHLTNQMQNHNISASETSQPSSCANTPESIQSFTALCRSRESEASTLVSSQSDSDLTVVQSSTPRRRTTTGAAMWPPLVQPPSINSSDQLKLRASSLVPNYLLPAKCITHPQTLGNDIFKTVDLQKSKQCNPEFIPMLHSTVGSQVGPCADQSANNTGICPANSNLNQNVLGSVIREGDGSRSFYLCCNETNPLSCNQDYQRHTHFCSATDGHGYSQRQNRFLQRISLRQRHFSHPSNDFHGHPSRHCCNKDRLNRRSKEYKDTPELWRFAARDDLKNKDGVSSTTRRSLSLPGVLSYASLFPNPPRMRRTSSLDERLLITDERMPRQGSTCRSDSMSRDGSVKRGRSKAMSIMQTPTHDMAFQHLTDQINSMQDMIDRRLNVLEEAYFSTTVRLERLANSHEVLIRMFRKVVHNLPTTNPDTQCSELDDLHSSCV